MLYGNFYVWKWKLGCTHSSKQTVPACLYMWSFFSGKWCKAEQNVVKSWCGNRTKKKKKKRTKRFLPLTQQLGIAEFTVLILSSCPSPPKQTKAPNLVSWLSSGTRGEAQFEQCLGSVTTFAATVLLLLDLHDLAGNTLWEVFQLTLGIILQLDQVSDSLH